MEHGFTLTITDRAPSKPNALIWVNLSRVAHLTGYSISHLSRVFARQTIPSLKCIKSTSEALGMDVGTFVDKLERGCIHVIKAGK